MHSPRPCNKHKCRYYGALNKNDPPEVYECKLGYKLGDKNCPCFEQWQEEDIKKGSNMETFKAAKQRLIDTLAKPFAKEAAKVFTKMGWVWAGEKIGADIYPDEKEIFAAICSMLNHRFDEDVDELGHFFYGTGRICISMFVWEHSKKWDIELTLSP